MSAVPETKPTNPLGDSIRTRRCALGLSRERLAVQSGLCSRTLLLIENRGHRPRTSTLLRIEKALGVPAGSLADTRGIAA